MFSTFIDFVIHNNVSIIQWLVVLVIGIAAAVIGLSIFGPHRGDSEDQPGTQAGGSVGVNSGFGPATMGPGGKIIIGGMEIDPLAQVKVTELKAEVVERAKEVEALKAKLNSAETESTGVSTYAKRVKDLESRLAEYEIIEDDIADLSLYKEENARLKSELKALGGAKPTPAAPEPRPDIGEASPPPMQPANSQAASELVDKFAKTVEQSKTQEPSVEPNEGDDLLTEFAASLADPGSPDGDLDTEKMIAEMADLDGAEGAPGEIEESTDMDKMAVEATKLLGNQ